MLFDQVVLEKKCFQFVRTDDEIDAVRVIDDAGEKKPTIVGSRLEIRTNPRPEIHCLADVDRFRSIVSEDVYTGFCG